MNKSLMHLFLIVLLLGCSKSEDETEIESPRLDVSSPVSAIESIGGQVSITIQSNTGWKIDVDRNICNIDTYTGYGNANKIITINENTTFEPREVQISISTTLDDIILKKIAITQSGKTYINIESISLSEKKITLKSNETYKPAVSFVPEAASNKNLGWGSLDNSVASVASDGTIRGINSGTTKIAVKSVENSNIKDSIEVTVFNPVERISVRGVYLNNPLEQIHSVSNELQLCHEDHFKIKIDVYPSNATNQNVVWSSSDTNLATVDNIGNFIITSNMALKGDVSIGATSEDGGFVAAVKIKVDDVHLKAQGMSIIQSGSGYTVQFISRIITSMEKRISIGSVLLENSDGSLIQIVSDITNGGYFAIVRSAPISFAYDGHDIMGFLATLKFAYVYKVTGQSDYTEKYVNINSHLWSNSVFP